MIKTYRIKGHGNKPQKNKLGGTIMSHSFDRGQQFFAEDLLVTGRFGEQTPECVKQSVKKHKAAGNNTHGTGWFLRIDINKAHR
jgi:hypothetical protein